MRKKIIFGFLLFLLCIAGFFLAWRYIHYLRDEDPNKTYLSPRAQLAYFTITHMDKHEIDMLGQILMHNPLPIAISFDSVEYQFFINDAKVMTTRYPKPVDINAGDSSWLTLPIKVYTIKLDSILTVLDKKGIDSVEYAIRTTFYKKFLVNRNWDVTVKQYLPLIHIPPIKINKVKIDSLSVMEAELYLNLLIFNSNVFAISVRDLSYQLDIDGNRLVEAQKPGLIEIPAQQEVSLTFPVKVTFKKIGDTLFELLTEGKNASYFLKMKLKLESKSKMLDNSQIIVESEGELKEIWQVYKGTKENK